jgi:hypothetical protein
MIVSNSGQNGQDSTIKKSMFICQHGIKCSVRTDFYFKHNNILDSAIYQDNIVFIANNKLIVLSISKLFESYNLCSGSWKCVDAILIDGDTIIFIFQKISCIMFTSI